jgi:hypothetical protein
LGFNILGCKLIISLNYRLMWEKLKKFIVQIVVLFINVALVGGGVAYFKNQQEKKDALQGLANNVGEEIPAETIDPIAEKAAQLQQIIDQTTAQKNENVAKNTGSVTVKQPKTVTQVIPGGTKNVVTTSPASVKSTTTPKPAKTTKKS